MRAQTPEGRKGRRQRLAGIRVGRSPPRSRSHRGGSGSGNGAHRPTLGWSRSRARAGKAKRRLPLARSASEPALLWPSKTRVHTAPDDDACYPPSPPAPPLGRPHTCYDVFEPDSPFGRSPSVAKLNASSEEAKVVVSVTVEGSVGPVKAMVRLGASVRETIAAVVERYAREGRSPRLDPAAADTFQLYHSYFSLESLNKNDKIGDVGGRNFYLHKNGRSNGLNFPNGEPDTNSSGSEIALSCGGQPPSAPCHYQVLTIVIKKLDKIGRRTKRIWRFITCDNCS